MKTQVLASIPFAQANPELLFHVLCTFSDEQVHELAKMNSVRESRNKYATVCNIVDNKDHINAKLDILA